MNPRPQVPTQREIAWKINRASVMSPRRTSPVLRFDGNRQSSYHRTGTSLDNQWRNRMPKIRHLAIKTKNPAKLAKFYEEVFGMKVIHSEKSGATYMSDGYLTLAILPNRGGAGAGGAERHKPFRLSG